MMHFSPKRNLLLDCDGVLLDWVAGFTPYAGQRLGKVLDPNGPPSFDLTGWLGCDTATYHQLVDDFNNGDGGFFGQLPAMEGAVEALTRAHDQGRKISIITACSTDPKVIAQREQNLVDVFGNIFSEIHCMPLRVSKIDHLKIYENQNVFWVEDKTENAIDGAELGHPSYVIRCSHNLHHEDDPAYAHPRMTWVDGWGCISRHEAIA